MALHGHGYAVPITLNSKETKIGELQRQAPHSGSYNKIYTLFIGIDAPEGANETLITIRYNAHPFSATYAVISSLWW